MQERYAAVYRDRLSDKIIRIPNISLEKARQIAHRKHGDVHFMVGYSSFKFEG